MIVVFGCFGFTAFSWWLCCYSGCDWCLDVGYAGRLRLGLVVLACLLLWVGWFGVSVVLLGCF